MSYNQCCKYLHKTTGLTVTGGNLVITATNTATLPSSKEPFCLIVCQNPRAVSATAIPVTITIAGTNYPVQNKYGVQMTSEELARHRRCVYKGYFVVDGADTYVIFNEVPKCC